ncbi:MAG TPA: ATP-binding domain-containing protein, partial [Exilispira sp.]|nr:ATP-binding domain-containing protein [Exilispira sp.]
QLSSVEAGRVFSDLKDFFLLDIKNKLNANIVELTKSYRYKAKSIIEESKEILYKILNSKNDEENKKQAECFVELMSKKERLIETEINNNLFDRIKKNFEEYNIKDFGLVISNIEADDRIKKQFELLRKFKFLSPLRLSKYGTFNINKSFANYLKKIKEKQFIPIIITKNNYQLNLFNGDIGIVEEENDEAYAYFENEEKDEPTRKFNLSSLSNWEPAYCLSVHKSQGSEFDIVVLFLPENIDRFEFITLELLYTAITRAKEDFYIVSAKHSLEKVLLKRTKRFTGLFTKLQTMI